ncbi:MAG: hypothetical protein QOE11_110 [Solirubrobacteraceae bacterium]|jgi:hypothetical protein|nr:hypothetical protein [Solirubrobacteraceae bacterium]
MGALALAAVALWALAPTYPDYDAYQHLVWGRDLLHGVAPGFETFAAPTQHPLYLALAALLSLAGQDADRLLVLVTVLSLVALTAGAYVLARGLFGTWPAVAAAFFVGSSFAFLLYAVRAFVDVPFLALVVWAAALEVARPRRGQAPMALLALAGLLRPEAWVLAGLYWLWCLPGRDLRVRFGLLALVVVSPLIWALVDLAVTGDPLFSLHSTSSLAEALGRERGLRHVPRSFVTFLADVARPPVAAAGVIGLVLALRRFGIVRMAVPLALLGAGALTFAGTGVAGLAILPRYLTVPAIALCLFAGHAVLGFVSLPPGPLRSRWRLAAIGALVVGVAFFAVKAASFDRLRAELRFIDRTHAQVSALLDAPQVRAGLRCGALTFPTYRLVPDARWLLHADARRVRSRAQDPAPGAVAVYIAGDQKFERRFGRADGVARATNRLPAGRPDLRQGPFAVYVRCNQSSGASTNVDDPLARDTLVEARQAVVGDRLPGSGVGDELARARAHAGVAVERAEADRDDLPAAGLAGQHGRPAGSAEDLLASVGRRPRAQVLLAGSEDERSRPDARRGRGGRARASLAARAVAVDRRDELGADLEAHGAAAAAAGEGDEGHRRIVVRRRCGEPDGAPA